MRVTTYVENKPGKSHSEDVIGYCENVFWLMDGATPPYGETAAKSTKEFLKTAQLSIFSEVMSSGGLTPLSDIAKNAIGRISACANLPDAKGYMPYSTLVMVRLSATSLEYIVIGDSMLIVEGAETTIVSDDRIKRCATAERSQLRSIGARGVSSSDPEYRAAHATLVEKEQSLLNNKDGYWVFSNNPEAIDESISGKIPQTSGRPVNILLVSDGFARLSTHLENPIPLEGFCSAITSFGPKALADRLRKDEADFAWKKGISSSKHDDMSCVLIELPKAE